MTLVDRDRMRDHYERDGGEKTFVMAFDEYYAMITEMAKAEAATVTRLCTRWKTDNMKR